MDKQNELITEETLNLIGFEKDDKASVAHSINVYRFTDEDGKEYTIRKDYCEDEWDLHIDDDKMMCIGSISCRNISTVMGILKLMRNEFIKGGQQ